MKTNRRASLSRELQQNTTAVRHELVDERGRTSRKKLSTVAHESDKCRRVDTEMNLTEWLQTKLGKEYQFILNFAVAAVGALATLVATVIAFFALLHGSG